MPEEISIPSLYDAAVWSAIDGDEYEQYDTPEEAPLDTPPQDGDDSLLVDGAPIPGPPPAQAPPPKEATRSRVVPFVRELKKGMSGKEVRAMKLALWHAGHRRVSRGTNHFGATTRTALMNFQRRKGLTADGVYGRATHAKLAAHYSQDAIYLAMLAKRQLEAAGGESR